MDKIENVELAIEEVESNNVLADTGYRAILIKILVDKRTDLLTELANLKFQEE